MTRIQTETFGILSILAGTFAAVFWMVVGWRAMRAHEKIAHALSCGAPSQRSSPLDRAKRTKDREEKKFREFLRSDPLARHLEADERMRRFITWKKTRHQEPGP